jgi:hypothetical protein
MNRRALLRLAAGVAALMLAGHGPAVMAADKRLLLADLEPDRMWLIYRRYRLLIVGQRDDEIGSAFAGAVVDVLARFLPTSRARLARAADSRRIGVLIGTNQQDVAIMAAESAEALFLTKPPFDDIRNVPLRLVVSFGSHVLVCRADFMARHAYLLAQTLAEHEDSLPAPARAPEGVVPAHRGSHAFFASAQMPNSAGAGETSGIRERLELAL